MANRPLCFAHNQPTTYGFFPLLKAMAEKSSVDLEGTLPSRTFSSAKGVASQTKWKRGSPTLLWYVGLSFLVRGNGGQQHKNNTSEVGGDMVCKFLSPLVSKTRMI
jgi:hypothetical protein